MKSITAEKLNLKFEPTVILWTNTKPEGALQIKPHTFACVMMYFAQVATKGKTAVFDRETYGCPTARAAFGLGDGLPDAFEGAGIDFISTYLTKGVESSSNPEAYRKIVEQMPEREREKFIYGERLWKDMELAKRRLNTIPITDISEKFVVLTPLSNLSSTDIPSVVIFLVDSIQISGLVPLVGSIYEADTMDAVFTPYGAGCQQIGYHVYEEAKKEHPRGVLGYTDPTARNYVGKTIPKDMFTFAVPYKLFTAMEKATEGGLFDTPTWKKLVAE